MRRLFDKFNLVLNKAFGPSYFVEWLRYLTMGGVNAVLTFFVFVVALKVLYINYLLALTAAFFTGTLFTYTLNFLWVFRLDETFSFNWRFFRHLIPNIMTFLANLGVLYMLVDYLGGDPFFCQILIMFAVIAINFFFAKFWAFRR